MSNEAQRAFNNTVRLTTDIQMLTNAGFRLSKVKLSGAHKCQLCGTALYPGQIIVDTPIQHNGRWAHTCPGCAIAHGTPYLGTIHQIIEAPEPSQDLNTTTLVETLDKIGLTVFVFADPILYEDEDEDDWDEDEDEDLDPPDEYLTAEEDD